MIDSEGGGHDGNRATIVSGRKEYSVEAGTTILQAMVEHDIDLRIVRPAREGEFVGLGEKLRPGDRVELIPVIAGG
jgi:sulfur carrier protein ThiS